MQETSVSLLERVRLDSDSGAWERLVDVYQPLLARWLRRYEVQDSDADDLSVLRGIARDSDAEVWMSAVITRDSERNARGVPEPVAHLQKAVDVILTMAHDGSGVHVGLHKDHDNEDVSPLRLALDPTTMLLVRE